MIAEDTKGTQKISCVNKMEKTGGLLENIALLVGSSEDGLRLLISILLGYPISFLHRKYLYAKPPTLQHIYFIVTGLALGWFNFGADIVHPVATIAISYGILAVLGGGTLSLALVFTYTMAHLLIGYWTTATSDYDIKWTMPQCVLTLRLIGLAFNMSDGQIPDEKLSAENKKTAIRDIPSPLEVFAHNLFPSSFLIGPQLPLVRYRQFVDTSLRGKEGSELPDSVRAGLLRGLLGIMYMTIFLIGSSYVTDEYILSDDFANTALWKRFLLLGCWGRTALYKYISCWLLTEGACIVIGLTYNGKTVMGDDKWDGCSNVKISIFETTTLMDHYIMAFNINTNHWVAQYIYKRLRFLNNKVLSQLGVLFFLAIWHGFHSGYYATFFFEFISILSEKEVQSLVAKHPVIEQTISAAPLSWVRYAILRVYTFTSMGYAMIAFILLKHRKYLQVYAVFGFSYHILYLAIIFGGPLLRKYVLPRAKSKENKTKEN